MLRPFKERLWLVTDKFTVQLLRPRIFFTNWSIVFEWWNNRIAAIWILLCDSGQLILWKSIVPMWDSHSPVCIKFSWVVLVEEVAPQSCCPLCRATHDFPWPKNWVLDLYEPFWGKNNNLVPRAHSLPLGKDEKALGSEITKKIVEFSLVGICLCSTPHFVFWEA